MGRIIISRETDPSQNLALEEELLFQCREGTWLYLWQNDRTVVIGRNQNPYRECSLEYLKKEGIRLTRRLSGGGAVYHDLGNLNYTFFCREEEQDRKRQTMVIVRALAALGIRCAFSGRNDLLAEGRKFSGQAYYAEDGYAYHHGTIMVAVDLERMEQALRPSRLKLEGKGISSVRSRVVNLNMLSGQVTVQKVARALIGQFREAFGSGKPEVWDFKSRPPSVLEKYRRDEWNLGNCPRYKAAMDLAVGTGIFRLEAQVERGRIVKAGISCDHLEPANLEKMAESLTGRLFREEEIRQEIKAFGGNTNGCI